MVPVGVSVSISGEVAVVGATGDDDHGQSSGSAYVFDLNCPADLDGSRDVDFEDMLRVLTAWGNKDGPDDIDGSGVVDFNGLLLVLAAWGPCE